jgi:dTDP-4-dehydrorhamnose 3,5-epimerase
MGGTVRHPDPVPEGVPVIFTPLTVHGAFLVAPEPRVDTRGFFARTWCAEEFARHGLEATIAQCSISRSHRKGTLRGMHYQTAPHEEAKLVRCIRGAIHDVIIDIRPSSPTYLRHHAVELSAHNRLSLYVPRGVAHGFQTLEDDTEVGYQMSVAHAPDHASGVRWNDPSFGITWPIVPPIILERDSAYPDFAAAAT